MKNFNKSIVLAGLFLGMTCAFSACGSKSGSESAADSTVATAAPAAASGTEAPSAAIPENGLPSVIDFYATWCGPCQQISPLFHQLEEKYSGKVNFVSVDVDADSETAMKYAVEAMPTFVFLDADGKEVDRLVGADPAALTGGIENLAE